MGVYVARPSDGQLAEMVFGSKVHPDLLQFLLQKRLAYTQENYYKNAAQVYDRTHKILKLFDAAYIRPEADAIFKNASTCYFYDPRSLFESDEQFYALLAKHPQAQLKNFGQTEYVNASDGQAVLERDDAENFEDNGESEQPEQQTVGSKFK